MPFTVTRTQLLARLRDVIHETTSAGAYETARLIPHLQYALEEVWSDLTASEDGVGRVHENFTVAAGDPNGRVPGQSLPLPSLFAVLVAVRRNGRRLRPGTPDRREFNAGFAVSGSFSDPGRYWIDGPNQNISGVGAVTLTAATLLTTPNWAQGDVVEWVYIQKPPLLIAPNDPNQVNPTLEITLDLLEASIVAAVVNLAATFATARGDDSAMQRARTEAGRVIANYFKRAHDRDRGVQILSDFAPENTRSLWWLD
jgi:hypothetical protein